MIETKTILEIAKEWAEGKKYVAVDDIIGEIQDWSDGHMQPYNGFFKCTKKNVNELINLLSKKKED